VEYITEIIIDDSARIINTAPPPPPMPTETQKEEFVFCYFLRTHTFFLKKN